MEEATFLITFFCGLFGVVFTFAGLMALGSEDKPPSPEYDIPVERRMFYVLLTRGLSEVPATLLNVRNNWRSRVAERRLFLTGLILCGVTTGILLRGCLISLLPEEANKKPGAVAPGL